jgi:hypothetical protein
MKKLFIFLMLLPMIGYNQVTKYGYTATSSPWVANTSATTIIVNGQDESIVPAAANSGYNIGFTFTYNSVAYTQFKASTNGFLTFNTANISPQPTNNLKTSTERVILAVLWDDNKTGSSGTVNYKLSGTSPNRVLTVEWLNYRWEKYAFSSGVISCQIQLYETTNVIKYNYYRGANAYTFQNSSASVGFGASIGLGGATSGDFLSLSDLKASTYPTKSTTVETTTIGKSPTDFSATGFTAAMATTYIAPNVSPNDATTYIFYPPLANDNCSGGTSISVNNNATCTSTTSGTTLGASQTLAACVGTADDDVWYTFVATQTVHIVTETPGTIGDAVMQVYSGSCASLTTIACINDATTGNETTTLTGLTVGSTYYVRVHSFANGSGQGTFTMCVTTPPTILTVGTLASFSSCYGSVSSEQSYSISGSGLSSNSITITAPTGFEISITSGSGFTSPITLTPSSGIVSSTTIYTRLTSTATGSPSGNITNTSTNATTQNIAVSGTVTTSVTPSASITSSDGDNITCLGTSVTFTASSTNGGLSPLYQWMENGVNVGTNSTTYTNSSLSNNDVISCVMTANNTCQVSPTATSNSITNTVNSLTIGGTVASNQNVISGHSPNDILLTGNTGSVIKWVSSSDNLFTTTTDILVTNTTLSSSDMGTINSTNYYRAIVKNGVCSQDNSSYVKMTIVTALPIELLFLKGEKHGDYNHLTWSTSSEYNNDYFNIEKTQDGVIYYNIATIKGNGNSNHQIEYEYDDYEIDNNDINYYRLKQTDFDGIFKYSVILSVDNSSKKIKIVIRVINLYGTEVDIYTKGVLILIYDDGSIKKLYNE